MRTTTISRSTHHPGWAFLVLAVACCFLELPACSKVPPPSPPQPSASAPIGKLDVCSLIKREEVSGVQGSPVKQTKRSAFSTGKFLVSQCFYETTDPNKTVNLAVTSSDPASSRRISPGAFWKEKFAPYREVVTEGKHEGKKSEGEEEERRPPKKIDDLGDDAYWMGRDALYVLKGDVYLRLSIGGADSIETKIENAKKLIRPALARISASAPPAP